MKSGQPHGGTYVVCLDCGKQFEYDTREMRIGAPIRHSDEAGVLPPGMPTPRKKKIGYALLAAVPAAVVVGAALKGKKKTGASPDGKPAQEEKVEEKAEGGKSELGAR